MKFYNLTPTNGFDNNDLINARQNNYAWSISDLDGYIYVGTGRNILYNIIKGISQQAQIPDLINPDPVDNLAEIWRFKKNEKLPWERVYKAPPESFIAGFRFMIKHFPLGGSPSLYAAGLGQDVKILKTTNGVNWFILPGDLEGTSSRAMITHRGKLYVATVNELNASTEPLLYSSEDPEFFPWQKVIDDTAPGFDSGKNPRGAISNLEVFNNRIYVVTSNADGVQVWRTNDTEPRLNDWTLVVGNGFGNPANKYSLAVGVFNNHLYVSGTKQLPLSWFLPMGCDVVRIDKRDNWELVVGGRPFFPMSDSIFEKQKSISGLGSGFNNPFNVYAWQIQEYQDKLFISTFDDSSNMEVILTTLLKNKDALSTIIDPRLVNLIIAVYRGVVEILRAIRYPVGFDLYVSEDGVNFSTVFLNGLKNPHNYGGRLLFVDSCNDLYLGTANPFEGCEVWKATDTSCCNIKSCSEDHYENLWKSRDILREKYGALIENMNEVQKLAPNLLSDLFYKRF